MIISCPECSTRFILDDDQMPQGGRKLKCSNCLAVWHEGGAAPTIAPDAPEPEPAPPASEPEAVDTPEDTAPEPAAAPIAEQINEEQTTPKPAPTQPSTPVADAPKSGSKRTLMVVVLVLLVIGVGIGAFAYLKPAEFRALIGQEEVKKSVVAPKPGRLPIAPAPEPITAPEEAPTSLPDSLPDSVEERPALDAASEPLPAP